MFGGDTSYFLNEEVYIYDREQIDDIVGFINSCQVVKDKDYPEYYTDDLLGNFQAKRDNKIVIHITMYNQENDIINTVSFFGKYAYVTPKGIEANTTFYYIKNIRYNLFTKKTSVTKALGEILGIQG